MSDQSSKPPPNGAAEATPKRSVRDVAEAVYDDLLEQDSAAQEPAPEQSVDGDDRPRDQYGRFVAREAAEPGEADEPKQPVPAPQDSTTEPPPPQPAPDQGRSIEAPAHWSAEDRAAFTSEMTPKGRELYLRRYGELERDYTQKTQAAAQAVNFAQTLAPVFANPAMQGSLQQAGVAPSEAINQWGQFHLGIVHPDPQVRIATVQEIVRRAQIDPAALAPSRQGQPAIPPEALKDPAIKFFADQVGQLKQEILSNRQAFQTMQEQAAAKQAAEAQRVTEWQVNSFADEVDARGAKLHPYFDRVISEIMLLYRGDPQNFDMARAYARACNLNDEVRLEMQRAGQQVATQQVSNQRAAQAAKSNLRGRTTPVSAPNGTGEKRTLRETLESAADEAGIN